jgi:transposase
VLDQAGWHTTGKLHVPDNLSVLPLPPKSPELNPTENVWQFLRQNKLSNRIFGDDNAIVTAACEAWNSLPRRSRPHHLNRNPPLRHYRSQ